MQTLKIVAVKRLSIFPNIFIIVNILIRYIIASLTKMCAFCEKKHI